jgi:hypothetical protein
MESLLISFHFCSMLKPPWFGLSGKNKNTATLRNQMVTHPLAGQFTDAAVMP